MFTSTCRCDRKTKQTCLDRYGVEYALQNEEIKQKRRNTFQKNYGVDCPMKDPQFHQKMMETQIRKYEGIGFASKEIAEKIKQTCLERYGTENPNSSEIISDAKRKTWEERYGVDNPMKSSDVKERVRWARIENHAQSIKDEQARQNYLEFSKDPTTYILTKFDHRPSLIEISETLGNLDTTSISSHIPIKDHILLGNYQSSMERDITKFLKEIDPNIDIIIHDREKIKPYELDLYLPAYNFAIECNPTSSHNSTINVFDPKSGALAQDYHKNKSFRCIKNNIYLMHIFGYDWNTRKYVIQSMIRNTLHKSSKRYYARNLHVINISYNDCIEFLNNNHLQRSLSAPIRLGLVSDKQELLSVMTFNHIRHTMGKSKSEDTEETWELSRFCNKLNCSVVGAASKLFNYFIREYHPSKIISFSDIAHTKGSLYEILGFHQQSITDPSYVWVNLNSDVWYNRVSCQKKNLPKLFDEPDLDIINKTESMIMSEHHFVQVFDSGKIKWAWKSDMQEV